MGWFGKLLISAVLISFLSVVTTVYLVDQYVKAILDRWNLSEIDRPSLQIGEMFSSLTNPEISKEVEEPKTESTSGSEADAQETEEESTPPVGAVEAGTTPTSTPTTTPTTTPSSTPSTEEEFEANEEDETLPVFGQSDALGSLVMTAEEFNEKRKKLTEEDKLEIFTIMMKKLPQSELQKMSELIEDGVTEDEVKEMEDVINAYLHQDDVARLLSILNKY